MPSILVVLFWLWLGVSLAIYVRRMATTGSLRPQRPDDEVDSTTIAAPTRSKRSKPVRPTIDEELAAMAPPVPAPIPSAIQPTDADPDAPDAGTVAVRTEDAPLARTLADALAGIQMPCELAPLVSGDRIDPRNMLFATGGYPPEVVGTSVADELERLGYSFSPIDDQTLHARRGGTLVEVKVHPDKVRAAEALASRAATAAEDAVIVEFQLR